MLQEKEPFFLGGGGSKFALEAEEGDVPSIYDSLKKDLGVTEGIVIMTDVQANGHNVLTTWTGRQIDVEKLSGRSILRAGGTGCLEIAVGNGEKRTEIFFSGGHIIKTRKKGVDQKQGRLKI